MLLKTLAIESFRAFGSSQSAVFALPRANQPGSGLTIFVGPNNSGKSTVVRAIKNLLSHDATFIAGQDDRRGNSSPKLVVKFQTDKEIEVSLEPRANAAHLNKIGDYQAAASLLRFIPSRRPWSDRFSVNPGIDDSAYESSFYSSLKNNEFYVDQSFGQAMHVIDRDSNKRKQFLDLLRQLESTISDWAIDNDGARDFISFKSISGGVHRAGLLGDGVVNLFRIAYALFSLKAGEVLILDEPELSLHPQCQRRLHEVISKRAASNQIILSTHSPYFISWSDIRRGCKIYRANLREGLGAEIGAIDPNTLHSIIAIADKDIKNRKLYDIVAKEIFFSRGCLLVEGQEDAHLISRYIEEVNGPSIEVFGHGSGGADNILTWIQMSLDIGIRSVGLFDGDGKGKQAFENARKEFGKNKNVLLRILPTPDVRDKHKIAPNGRDELPEIDKEGLFTCEWLIKAKHKGWLDKTLEEIAKFLEAEWVTPPSPSPAT